ncbi:MAG: hypothetical protein IIY55_00450 [Blautia sp.]|nr:hypothetical protein [Blautia sp.]
MEDAHLYEVIKYSLWNTGNATGDAEILEEMRNHGIAVLAFPVLKDLSLTPELFQEWDRLSVRQFGYYFRYI